MVIMEALVTRIPYALRVPHLHTHTAANIHGVRRVRIAYTTDERRMNSRRVVRSKEKRVTRVSTSPYRLHFVMEPLAAADQFPSTARRCCTRADTFTSSRLQPTVNETKRSLRNENDCAVRCGKTRRGSASTRTPNHPVYEEREFHRRRRRTVDDRLSRSIGNKV